MAYTHQQIESELREQLQPSNDRAFDYDGLHELLQNHDSEEFDVFVRLAYHLSQMVLSPAEMSRASRMMTVLAMDVLEFNVMNSDVVQSDDTIDMIYDGYCPPEI